MIGFRELVLIAMVAAALYGRSGVLKSDRAKTVMPWISPVRRGGRKPPKPVGASLIRGDRLFWALALIAAAAVAAWIVTRTLIAAGPH
ncbi:hypothetical protein [Paludisphaera rhizosphaerae]|uniref:hypothetical protein n=1 Tax=Paludisphaera rhizosphaerae TaxID=2711216 RepID=UPI0013ED3B79|nr:hypothetical protein [Paludisphaera rhizosphaerae]